MIKIFGEWFGFLVDEEMLVDFLGEEKYLTCYELMTKLTFVCSLEVGLRSLLYIN